MSDTCRLLPPFGDRWPSCLLLLTSEPKKVSTTVPTAKLSADHRHSDVIYGFTADTAPGPIVKNFQPPSTLLVLAHHPEGQAL